MIKTNQIQAISGETFNVKDVVALLASQAVVASDEPLTEAYKQTDEYKIAECTNYLASTDWYASRLAETGKDMPHEVRENRARCREYLSTPTSQSEPLESY